MWRGWALGALLTLWAVPLRADDTFDPDETTGHQLIAYLDHAVVEWRLDAIEEIEDRELLQAEDKLAELACCDPHEGVRRKALNALADLRSERLQGAAERVARGDEERRNRRRALALLEDHADDSAVSAVAAVLAEDSEEGLRRKAAVIIRKRGWSDAAPVLASAALEDRDEGVREAAREALVEVGGEEHRSVLHRILREETDIGARRDVCEWLADRPQAADREALIAALDDADERVQREAARGLMRLGDASVAPILRDRALATTDEDVAEEFNEAASRLEGR